MKWRNLIVSKIYFSFVILVISFFTFLTMSWAQEKNETAPASPKALNVPQAPLPKVEPEKASSYINMTTVVVKAGDNNSATILCDKGDLLLNGGYDLQFKNPHNVTSVFIYSNHPTGNMTKTVDPQTLETTPSLQEGWETGLLNNGNEDVKVTAEVLCAKGR